MHRTQDSQNVGFVRFWKI